jgi:parvulin-like peptidyl-prolyl isomerase
MLSLLNVFVTFQITRILTLVLSILLLINASAQAQENISTTANTAINSNYIVTEIIGDNFIGHHSSIYFSIEHSMLSVDELDKSEDNIEFNLP